MQAVSDDNNGKTFDRIKALMLECGVPPTPVNYEFWYRYVTGADPQFVEEVDSLLGDGAIGIRALSKLRRKFYGHLPDDALNELMDAAKGHLERISEYVDRTGGDARLYKEALNGSGKSLETALDVETQRALLSKLAAATHAMVEKTSALEAQLALSSKEIAALRNDLETARSESRTDPLTSLPNRKAFNAYLEAQSSRALADHKPLSIVFLDIDHFKQFNDRWGHHMGDEVLRLVGQSMEHFFHGMGFAARFGGEEFVIVLPSKNLEAAGDIAEQFRDFISSRTIRSRQRDQDVGKITLSLGISQMRWTDTIESFVERADKALYVAKQNGRNQVAFETPEDVSTEAA